MRKKSAITWIVILAVVILAFVIINRPIPETPEDVAKCIGENSELYIQLGCHACETQERLFGDNYQYLNVISGEKGAIGLISTTNKDSMGAIPTSPEDKKALNDKFTNENGVQDGQTRVVQVDVI